MPWIDAPFDVPALDGALAAFEYRFPVDRMIHRFKYRGDLALGRWLAQCLAARLHGREKPGLLVATPLSPARLRERGFDQALEIAKVVGRALAVPVALRAVVKVRETEAQRTLGARSRRANLRAAFRCRARLDGKCVAVVDDVITTGATAGAVAAALRAAGAARVEAWSVARTI